MQISLVFEKLGSQSALARALGIKPQAVQKWNRIPSKRLFKVSQLTGISVTDLAQIGSENQNGTNIQTAA